MANLSSIITPTNLVTLTGTSTLTNKTLTAPTIASANLTTALTLAGAAGTNGQVLTSAGSGLPSWTTLPSPPASALTLLSTVTASTSATVDIETTFSSTYDVYLLVVSGLTISINNRDLYLRMKLSGTYATSGYIFLTGTSTAAGATFDTIQNTSSGQIQLHNSLRLGSAADDSANFSIYITNPASTTLKKQIYYTGSYTNGSNLAIISGSGSNTGTGELTGIRMLMPSGNIVAGTFRLYGIANS